MDEPENPNLYVAAENSPEDLKKRQALDQLRWPTRQLVSNLLRVMRGAGKPNNLPSQIMELGVAVQEAWQINNAFYVGAEIEDVLWSAIPDDSDEHSMADRTIVKGAAQVMASSLVHQRAQEAAGEREMYEGSGSWSVCGSATGRRSSKRLLPPGACLNLNGREP